MTAAAGTRERLLEAAGEAFSRAGFRRATVREIARRARANVAAANYHFGGKEGLYGAVLERSLRAALEKHPPAGGLGADAPPEELLRAFVRSLLRRLFDDGPHARLMSREMAEPTAALDGIVRQIIRPLYARLRGIVRALAGPGVPEERVRRCARSVVGQCFFYKLGEPVLRRLEGPRRWTPAELDGVADHVASFSLAGIRRAASGRSR
jgi:AcrR family transcriptional regulator